MVRGCGSWDRRQARRRAKRSEATRPCAGGAVSGGEARMWWRESARRWPSLPLEGRRERPDGLPQQDRLLPRRRGSRAGPPSRPATTGTPEARASTTTRPKGSGSLETWTNTSRSAITSSTSRLDPIQRTPGVREDLAWISAAYPSLPGTGDPTSTTSMPGWRGRRISKASRRVPNPFHVSNRATQPIRTTESAMFCSVLNRPARDGEKRSGSASSVTTSTGAPGSWFATTCDIAITRAAKWRVSHLSTRRADPDWNTTSRALPHVRAADQDGDRPAVPRVQGVRVHDVYVDHSGQAGELDHRQRPAGQVPHPAQTVAGRGQPLHGYDVQVCAGSGILGRQPGLPWHGDVALPPVSAELADHTYQGVLGTAAVTDGLDREDALGADCGQC